MTLFGTASRLSACLTFILSVGLGACARVGANKNSVPFYSGPRLPRDQVALLGSENCGDASPVRLIEVDGELGAHGPAYGYSDEWDGGFCLELLPGPHDLTVRYVGTDYNGGTYFSKARVKFALNARAGHVYELKALVGDLKWRPIVVDVTNRGVGR